MSHPTTDPGPHGAWPMATYRAYWRPGARDVCATCTLPVEFVARADDRPGGWLHLTGLSARRPGACIEPERDAAAQQLASELAAILDPPDDELMPAGTTCADLLAQVTAVYGRYRRAIGGAS